MFSRLIFAISLAISFSAFATKKVPESVLEGDSEFEKVQFAHTTYGAMVFSFDASMLNGKTGRGSEFLDKFEIARDAYIEVARAINAVAEAMGYMRKAHEDNPHTKMSINRCELGSCDKIDDDDVDSFNRTLKAATLQARLKVFERFENIQEPFNLAYQYYVTHKQESSAKHFDKIKKALEKAMAAHAELNDLNPHKNVEGYEYETMAASLIDSENQIAEMKKDTTALNTDLAKAKLWQQGYNENVSAYNDQLATIAAAREEFEEYMATQEGNPISLSDVADVQDVETMDDITAQKTAINHNNAVISEMKKKLVEAKKWEQEQKAKAKKEAVQKAAEEKKAATVAKVAAEKAAAEKAEEEKAEEDEIKEDAATEEKAAEVAEEE